MCSVTMPWKEFHVSSRSTGGKSGIPCLPGFDIDEGAEMVQESGYFNGTLYISLNKASGSHVKSGSGSNLGYT